MSQILSEIKKKNTFLDLYLRCLEDTESPRVFHLWCAITGIAACLGRRTYLPFGMDPIYPNMYSVLVGPPATRKNTAINFIGRLLKQQTRVRFAPDDTGGQRQGLIKAFVGKEIDEDDPALNGIELANGVTVEQLSEIDMGLLPDSRDKFVLFAKATELQSLIGINSSDIITFLNKMYDGEEYKYGLKNETDTIIDTALTILAAATPTNLAKALPVEAIGQGFMSRLILIFGTKKYKRIPEPILPSLSLWSEVEKLFKFLSYEFAGEMSKSAGAKKRFDQLYEIDLQMNDTRFVHYQERRYTHLMKTAMVLAATRKSLVIEEDDVDCAHLILSITEATMPDALGEYGMSPIAAAKQKMIEFIESSKFPVGKEILRVLMHRDMRLSDFNLALLELANTGRIKQVDTGDGPGYVCIDKTITEVDEVIDFLTSSNKRKKDATKSI